MFILFALCHLPHPHCANLHSICFLKYLHVRQSYLWIFPDGRVMVKAPDVENHSYSCERKETKKITGGRTSWGRATVTPLFNKNFLLEGNELAPGRVLCAIADVSSQGPMGRWGLNDTLVFKAMTYLIADSIFRSCWYHVRMISVNGQYSTHQR